MTDPRSWGIQPEYSDAGGDTVVADPAVVARVLTELSAGAEQPGAPGAIIVRPGDALDRSLEVTTEDGRALVLEGHVPPDLPLGYHALGDGGDGASLLICTPGRCFLPPDLRLGGWALQVYAMRSRRSWGVGDLADLRDFGEWAAGHGDGFALINPLAAASPSRPVEASPYLPTSRRFRNPLYLRVDEVPGASSLGADLEDLAEVALTLNAEPLIDRDAVMAIKLAALARVHERTPPPLAFRRWRRAMGEPLRRFALFCAIAEELGGDWRLWPEPMRDPASAATRAAARRLAARVTFFAWLQWALELQLEAASTALPLMHDLPIGVDPGGADVWSNQDVFAAGFSVGAPPDLFNRAGQDWSQSPFHPWRLRAAGYAPLVAVLRAALQSAAALRIDHVMGLFRLWWIPEGESPDRGVFVRYPAADILDIVALESVRASAHIVGEDLGTVEPIVRKEMAARDILSYRLLWFEDEPPSQLPERSMSAVTTHDLPTVVGLWSGNDLAAQRSIGLAVNEHGTVELAQRLERVVGDAWHGPPGDVICEAYTALAASPSMLVAAALEDAAEVAERPNMPGTTAERWPNWRRALPRPLDDLLEEPLPQRLARILRRA